MSWVVWLGIALAIGVLAALTGAKPAGSRPVARTRLMGVARLILFVGAAIFLFLAYRGCAAR